MDCTDRCFKPRKECINEKYSEGTEACSSYCSNAHGSIFVVAVAGSNIARGDVAYAAAACG